VPDINKCRGFLDTTLCGVRNECHRYKVNGNSLCQSYLILDKKDFNAKEGCSMFWEIKPPKKPDRSLLRMIKEDRSITTEEYNKLSRWKKVLSFFR
jgi:hypothetical protein